MASSNRSSWHELLSTLRDRLAAAGTSNPEGVRFLLSAHASHEELFLFRRLAGELIGDAASAIAVSWRYRPKSQPDGTTFRVAAVDAPNVNGARMLGLAPGTVGDEVPRRGHLGVEGCGRRRPRVGAVRLRSRSGRLDWRHGVDCRRARARRAAAPDRARRGGHRSGSRRRFRAAWCIVRREGRVIFKRPGASAGRRAGDRRRRARRWRTGRFS